MRNSGTKVVSVPNNDLLLPPHKETPHLILFHVETDDTKKESQQRHVEIGEQRQKNLPILGIEPRIFSFSRVGIPTSETQYHYAKRAS